MSDEMLEALAAIAAGRDHLTTAEFAYAIGKSPQTVRKNHCLEGECYGIRPIKIGNNLLWPVGKTARLLSSGQKSRPSLPAIGTAPNEASVTASNEANVTAPTEQAEVCHDR